MKQKGITLVLFGLSFLFSVEAFAYKEVPALIHLNKDEQADSSGFNLVTSLSELVFREIQSGSISLYDSPNKKIKISAEALLSLQTSSGTNFTECPDLFIHEYWSSNRKSTSFEILGFSFINKNRIDEKVAYGYVDMEEIQSILNKEHIPCNANGVADLSFEDALLSRNYYYHLVQFGDNGFYKDPVKAVQIKLEAFGSGKTIRNQLPLQPKKRMVYELHKKKYTTDIDISNSIIEGLQKVLNENPELFFNLGGARFVSFPDTLIDIPELTGILVDEVWVKKGGKPVIQSIKLKLFTTKGDLDWVDYQVFEEAGFMVEYKNLLHILRDKDFEFELQKINDQPIDSSKGRKYFEALKKAQWSSISEYVAL